MTTRIGNTAGARTTPYSAPDNIRADVLRGLLGTPKTLPPKLFYDRAGARLFEAICELPEYYLTRTELGILERRADEIASLCGDRTALIEYGSGAGTKVLLLLDALVDPAAYVPVDISMEQLATVAAERARQYPHLRVAPVHADYTTRFTLPALGRAKLAIHAPPLPLKRREVRLRLLAALVHISDGQQVEADVCQPAQGHHRAARRDVFFDPLKPGLDARLQLLPQIAFGLRSRLFAQALHFVGKLLVHRLRRHRRRQQAQKDCPQPSRHTVSP